MGWSGRQLESNLAGSAHPDLVARRASDGRAVILPTFPKSGGGYRLARAIVTRINLRNVDRVMNAGDWDRDGHSDIIGRHRGNGALYIWTGHGDGTFDGVRLLARSFGRIDLLAAVGDVTGDGWPDLMGQPRGGPMKIYPGIGLKGHAPGYVASSRISAGRQIPIGRWNGDGAPDTLYRSSGTLTARDGNGPGGITGGPRSIKLDLGPFDWVVGISDVGLSGHPDLVLRARSSGKLWLVRADMNRVWPREYLGTAAGYDLVG